jgi:hypothetical protein
MSRAALGVVIDRVRAGEWPRPAEYRALLEEVGATAADTQAFTAQYSAALQGVLAGALAPHVTEAGRSSGEASVLQALRSFSIEQ